MFGECIALSTNLGNEDKSLLYRAAVTPFHGFQGATPCQSLMDDAKRGANAIVSIDLEKQEIKGPDGGTIKFEVDAFRKHCLLNGLDDIGLTLQKGSEIDSFEGKQKSTQPWLHRRA